MAINRIILSGGGTGGHIYPALSIYRQLKEINPDLECLYVGSNKGLEKSLVSDLNIPFKSVEIQGLQRKLSFTNFKSIWLFLRGINQSKTIINEFNPDVIVGTGGYVCAPVLYAGAKLNIPTLIHEQNSVAGLTNKLLSKYVDIIATCFKSVEKDFSKYSEKIRYTGNPRAQEVSLVSKDELILKKQFNLDSSLPTVLIFGGSRGAPAINEAAIEALNEWNEKNYQVIIATGDVHYQEIKQELDQKEITLNKNVKIVPYIKNMPVVFQNIDLVVCRSGATTLTELMALGLPSILVPSPYVTANHQEYNAKTLVDEDAALMILQKDLTSERLVSEVDQLMSNPNKLQSMSENNKRIAITDSIDRIIHELNSLI